MRAHERPGRHREFLDDLRKHGAVAAQHRGLAGADPRSDHRARVSRALLPGVLADQRRIVDAAPERRRERADGLGAPNGGARDDAARAEREERTHECVRLLAPAGSQGARGIRSVPLIGRYCLGVAQRDDREGAALGVWGFTGLMPQEGNLTGPQQGLVAGRWLAAGEQDVCLLPVGLADSLGIDAASLPGARVRIFGEVFRVVGLLADDALDRPDLSGESLTPLDPEAQQPTEAEVGGQGGQLQPFAHLPGASTPVLPFAALMRWEGAQLASVGIGFPDAGPGAQRALDELAETLDLNLFVGLDGQRFLVNTVGVASISGLGQLVVPLAIAALIVFNTMLGSVYERTREIGTFNAVGLAPGHVSGLFMAEAVALGVVGVVSGYLLGQAAAQLLGHWGLLQGLQLNYSSFSAVLTIGLIVMLVTASALYPARMAGQICTPGIERRWKLPTDVEGDRIDIRLPFSLARHEALGMAAFQAEFWAENREQSIGAGFYVEALGIEREGDSIRLEARVWLAPFDQGVVQDTVLEFAPGVDPDYCDIDARLELAAGDRSTWHRVVRTFLDDVRKQFLVWRTLDAEDRRHYAEQLPHWQRVQDEVES